MRLKPLLFVLVLLFQMFLVYMPAVGATEYVYETMEDGILPDTLNDPSRVKVSLDANSSLSGKYCLNYSQISGGDAGYCINYFDETTQFTEYSYKFIIKEMEHNSFFYLKYIGIGSGSLIELMIRNDSGYEYEIRVNNLNSYVHFDEMEPWKANIPYTVTISNIVWKTASSTDNSRFDITLSNATASQTLTNYKMRTYPSIYGLNSRFIGFAVSSLQTYPMTVFVDDWTMGVQSDVETNTATGVLPTNANLKGTVVNDGSPYQNGTQNGHTVSFYYGNQSFNDSYVFYFNEYNASQKWFSSPADMCDNDNDTTAGTAYGDNQKQNLINHTGNIVNHPTEKIEKVELRTRAWTPLSSAEDGAQLFLQPRYNATINGSKYNVMLRYDTETDSEFWDDSMWQDITLDAPFEWNWTNLCNLDCTVISENLTDTVWATYVQLRVSVNLTYNYTSHVNVTGLHSGDTFASTVGGLTPGQLYYYRAYINTSYVNASSYDWGDEQYFLTKPEAPTSVSGTVVNTTTINISWVKGTGANNTVLVKKSTGYPSSVTDGTVLYNGTASFYIIEDVVSGEKAYFRLWSYANWTTQYFEVNQYSNNYSNAPWGALIINCYDENTSENLTFDVFIANEAGTEVYNESGATNTHIVNVTNCPHGDKVSILISAVGYENRLYYLDLYEGAWYAVNAFLAPVNNSELYLFQVIDAIEQSVPDAYVEVKAYTNITGIYEHVSTLYSDGNGYCEVYLIPGVLYKVTISKTGYQIRITDYLASDSIFTHVFKLQFEESDPVKPYIESEEIDFYGEISGTTLTLTYSDNLNRTINTQIFVYVLNSSTGEETLLTTDSRTGNDGFQIVITNINTTNTYKCQLYYNHTHFGHQSRLWISTPDYTPFTDETTIDTVLSAVVGTNPMGWGNMSIWFFLIAACFYADQRDTGKILVLIGGMFLFLNVAVGFNTTLLTVAGGVIPTLFIVVGILKIWNENRKRVIG